MTPATSTTQSVTFPLVPLVPERLNSVELPVLYHNFRSVRKRENYPLDFTRLKRLRIVLVRTSFVTNKNYDKPIRAGPA